jgi:DNA (cytosine-5)-methyltransferase 1
MLIPDMSQGIEKGLTVTIYKPGIISFFSGCGILDLGFEHSGFRTWMANELNPAFAEAYTYARQRMDGVLPVCGPVVEDTIAAFFDGARRVQLEDAMAMARAETAHADGSHGVVGFIGGPPCPDFSIAGKQAGRSGDHGRLTQDYFDLIGIMRPDFFVFENVRGLKSTGKHRLFFDEILAGARADGYAVTETTVNALEFGVPQDRHRVIVIGFHNDAFPNAQAMADGFGWNTYKTHAGAIRGAAWPKTSILLRGETGEIIAEDSLPPPGMAPEHVELTVKHWFDKNGVAAHPNAHDIFNVKNGKARFRLAREGDTSQKSFKRLHRWRYSPTAAYGNNEVHLHPTADRRISVAEAMAIQSLPGDFVLPPGRNSRGRRWMTLSDKFKTIGNGVPFLLAKGVSSAIMDSLAGQGAHDVVRDPERCRTEIVLPANEMPGSEPDFDVAPELSDEEIGAMYDAAHPEEVAALV